MLKLLKCLSVLLVLSLTACGDSGSSEDYSDSGVNSGGESDGYELLVAKNYSTSSVKKEQYKLIMPIDGYVDFASRGVQITALEMNNSPLFSFSRDSNGGTRKILAGEYILNFDFWNRR
ncbi:MAG: hypothetical protein ACJAS1_006330, partial [Oleiphilaceae bacterium]